MLEINNIMNKTNVVENGGKVRGGAPTSSLLQSCTRDSQALVDECTVKPYSVNRRIKEDALFSWSFRCGQNPKGEDIFLVDTSVYTENDYKVSHKP